MIKEEEFARVTAFAKEFSEGIREVLKGASIGPVANDVADDVNGTNSLDEGFIESLKRGEHLDKDYLLGYCEGLEH